MEICSVCGDHSTGRHYGASTCEGCKLFFKRSIKKRLFYTCRVAGCCPVNKRYRNSCQYCRMRKCLAVGMKQEAVQQARAHDFDKVRRRQKRQQHRGDLRKETDFASLSDFVFHLQAVEPYCRRSGLENFEVPCSESNSNVEKTEASRDKRPTEKTGEMAARLLFMTAHWAKKVKHFSELSHFDQVTLIRENWCKVFIINLVQWAMPFEIAPVVGELLETTSPQHVEKVLKNMGKLNEVIFKLVQLQLGRAEFSLLKALALFNPDTEQLADAVQIQAVQNKTQNALEEYIRQHYPHTPNRFGQLLLRLTALSSVDCKTIEHAFFNKLLGGASIYTLVDGILRAKDLNSE